MAWNPALCKVMSWGCCTVCTNKCPASDHVKEKWRYVIKTRRVNKTNEEMKKQYEKNELECALGRSRLQTLTKEVNDLTAADSSLNKEEMQQKYEKYQKEKEKECTLLENLEKEMKLLTAEKSRFLDESYQHVVRLEQIALKADSASTTVHLDFLIEKMKQKGDRKKVKKLEKLKRISLTSSPHEDIISKSFLISSGPPAVYQLRPQKQKFGSLTRITVGEKNPDETNRTILLVGETGAGKSTLINALLNYTMGVKWEDGVWFMITEEERRSQTSDVMVYEIFGFEDETLPYSLTIIDTPGYRDTRGIEHDDIISHRLLDLFQSEDGVHEISAVGLVMKASENRLDDRLKNVLDSVMSLFGKNLEKNIIALITHSEASRPKNPLQALEDWNIKCAKKGKNQPVYFLFDNCQHEERMEENTISKNTWELTQKNMDQFTDFLEKSSPQKLMTTVEVLNERIRLKASIQNLKERIKLAEVKQRETRNMKEALKQAGNKMDIKKILSLSEYLENEMKQLTAEKSRFLDESYQHAVRLEQIALKADSASTMVHLDFLIEKMKQKGDTEKVQKLEEMRR
uniref:AIG1-type G domain-containing protein n=1 Tax=Astatotilapia calliptera TaxID=8154 RepID=A0A3P8NWP5_ASTCA